MSVASAATLMPKPLSLIAVDEDYRRQYPRAVGLAYALTGRRHLAEEVAQDAFIAAYRGWVTIPSVIDSAEIRARDLDLPSPFELGEDAVEMPFEGSLGVESDIRRATSLSEERYEGNAEQAMVLGISDGYRSFALIGQYDERAGSAEADGFAFLAVAGTSNSTVAYSVYD